MIATVLLTILIMSSFMLVIYLINCYPDSPDSTVMSMFGLLIFASLLLLIGYALPRY